MTSERLVCPSCNGSIQITRTCTLTICDHCDAILRIGGGEPGARSGTRLRGAGIEEAIEDLKRTRASLRSGFTDRSRLYGCLSAFMDPRIVIGQMGLLIVLVVLFFAFGKATEDTMFVALILLVLIGLPLLILASYRVRGWLRFGPQIKEINRTISAVSQRLAAIQANARRRSSQV